jgi:hypothetical protein
VTCSAIVDRDRHPILYRDEMKVAEMAITDMSYFRQLLSTDSSIPLITGALYTFASVVGLTYNWYSFMHLE